MTEGLNELIFHLLWTKDKVFDSIVKVSIPHTIIYQYYQPRFWYFTSVDGSIKKKSKDKLKDEHIETEYLKKISPSGIVAVLFYMEDSKRIIEYLTLPKFMAFIRERKKYKTMMLQKFVDPSGENNISYSVMWTSNFCMFEKKKNKLKLYNEKFDIFERAVTFEGKDYHVISSPIRGSLLPNRLMRTADSIVSHVAAVTFEKMRIIRMVLQLKLDRDDRLWLICATSLRFLNDPVKLPVELNIDIDVPNDLNVKNVTVFSNSPAVFIRNIKCANCMERFEQNKVIGVTYETIFQVMKDNPVPIYNLHPKLSPDDLRRLKGTDQFLQKKTYMCFTCYMNFIERQYKTPKPTNLPLIGTGPLRPSIMKRTSTDKNLTASRFSSVEGISCRSSLLAPSFISPTNLTHSSSTRNYTFFTNRASKTAGGELVINIPQPKGHA